MFTVVRGHVVGDFRPDKGEAEKGGKCTKMLA